MEAQVERKTRYHTTDEVAWMKGLIEQHGVVTAKIIRDNNIIGEYNRLFGKTLTEIGMYTWAKYIADPGYKKRYAQRKKEGRVKQPSQKLEVFQKSQFIVYVNCKLLGFEDKAGLEEFMKEHKVLSEDIKVFKMLPVKVEYSVQIGVE